MEEFCVSYVRENESVGDVSSALFAEQSGCARKHVLVWCNVVGACGVRRVEMIIIA